MCPTYKNHCDFLPIGLLKIGSYHKFKGDKVKLVRGNKRCGMTPDRVLITSLFTYWSQSVHDTAAYYHEVYPNARIEIGGIYASLMYKDCKKRSPFAWVFRGLYRKGAAEKVKIDYSLLPDELGYQIIHGSRGCTRRCKFCGTWKIEPVFTNKESISREICTNRLIFYDNNFLANPHIEEILRELAETKYNGRVVCSESQCGIDGRLLTPKVAKMLKEARFANPRIAWDGSYDQWREIKKQIDMLTEARYIAQNIYVFMVYNFEIGYEEMKKKIGRCRKWGVQVADCRFRPLDQIFDGYNCHVREQEEGAYYIHPKWTDKRVRLFRRKVREQNIEIRYKFEKYSKKGEQWGAKRRREKMSVG